MSVTETAFPLPAEKTSVTFSSSIEHRARMLVGSVTRSCQRNRERFVVRVAIHVGRANGQCVSRVGFVVQQRTIGDRDLAGARVNRERTGDGLRLNRVGQRLCRVEHRRRRPIRRRS